MISIIKTVLISIVCIVVLSFACLFVKAEDFNVDEVSINYKRFIGETRHPLFLHSKQKEEVDLNLNTTFLNYFFWNNTVHSMTDASQYRIVGWNLFLGIRVFDNLDLQVEHFSKHLLDEQYSVMRFPVENSVGFKWYLIRPKSNKESMF